MTAHGMTKDEAINLLATEGPSVVGTKLHPKNWPLFEWAEIVAKAAKANPNLAKDIAQMMASPKGSDLKATLPMKPEPVHEEHIQAQNVHDYFYRHWQEHNWGDLRSFVCSRPPFPRMLISYDAFSFEGNKRLPDIRTGVHVSEIKDLTYTFSDIEASQAGMERIEQFRRNTQPDLLLGFQSSLEGRKIPGVLIVALDKLGRILSDGEDIFIEIKTPDTNEHYSHILHRDSMVALATINFMNCRNIELVDNPPSRQSRRYSERTKTPPPVTYKTLVLHPFGKRNRALQRSEAPNPGNTALHIVRGHFKDYRAGVGLGRAHIKGLWWWGPQVRGTNPERVVEKDYAVEAQ